MLVDSSGNPLVADVIGPMYGPTRFEEQPAWVRKRGRKGKALSWRRKARRSAARSGGRRSRRSYARGGRRISRKRNRADYRKFLSTRAGTYGPVRFEDQPTWVRRRGRKSKNRGRSANRRRWSSSYRTRRGGRKASRRRTSRAMTRRQKKALNRARFRAQRSRRSTRRGGYRTSRRGASRRRTSASRRISYGSIMKQLRGSRNKAWVCAGPTRTGCGGGRRGRRGSRVIGIIRG